MGIWLLVRILFALWAAGLVGAGVMANDSGLCAAARGTWFGSNLVQIGASILLAIWVAHNWSKAPAGSTFWGKVKFTLLNSLAWIKAGVVKFLGLFGAIPEPK